MNALLLVETRKDGTVSPFGEEPLPGDRDGRPGDRIQDLRPADARGAIASPAKRREPVAQPVEPAVVVGFEGHDFPPDFESSHDPGNLLSAQVEARVGIAGRSSNPNWGTFGEFGTSGSMGPNSSGWTLGSFLSAVRSATGSRSGQMSCTSSTKSSGPRGANC